MRAFLNVYGCVRVCVISPFEEEGSEEPKMEKLLGFEGVAELCMEF